MCEQTDADLAAKESITAYNIYTQIMSASVITAFIIYMRYKVKGIVKEYDDNNVTPSDYTLYFYVDQEQDIYFQKHLYDD